MRPTTSTLLLCAGLLLCLSGCGLFGCPDDEKVGDIELDADTRALIPYQGSEVLTFQDSLGNTLTLDGQGEEIAQNQLCVREICTEARIKGETSCEYVDSESRSYSYQSDSAIFQALFYTELAAPESEQYVDLLRISFSYGVGSVSAFRVIKERDGSGTYDSLPAGDTLTNVGTLTLGGQVYNDVWTNRYADFIQLYYTDAEGLIAFEQRGQLWTRP
mgnify:CR=1 FL=1